ncbi:hypothetical protein GCM10023168_17590 [Fodinibacter luteus]|uniref:Uncharacterized protein n=1 Tax=Fodinibacter luteus TaxID=552064 RepID=A0ABP8KEF0_9MICO
MAEADDDEGRDRRAEHPHGAFLRPGHAQIVRRRAGAAGQGPPDGGRRAGAALHGGRPVPPDRQYP